MQVGRIILLMNDYKQLYILPDLSQYYTVNTLLIWDTGIRQDCPTLTAVAYNTYCPVAEAFPALNVLPVSPTLS